MGDRPVRNRFPFLLAAMVAYAPAVLAAAPPTPDTPNKVTDTFPTAQGELRVTPLYQGAVMFQFGGKTLYVDPWSRADYTGLPPADLIVVTHTHADHLDRAQVVALKKPGTLIVGPDAVIDTLNCAPDCGEARTVNNGEKKTISGIGFEGVAMYNLVNGSAPGMPFHHKGVGSGYVFTFGGVRVYVAGDTECTQEMKALKAIDVAFVPMNPPKTMPPVEAAACVKAFKPKVVYPYHYRGFKPSDFADALKGTPGVEVRIRKLEGEP
ncbi:MAG TPA: MBL fold metallo-hydrolase [Caulobacteraceae bacterium]|jgi:L-ascorbate metabolism protein UlaG (beta-lactamase superfamily)|nr:MBL fold metallo-hydrolase [Caulobacteraceae bacterium]